MHNRFVLLFTLFLAGSAWGQPTSVVPDTLDWKRYYPLAVGNMWEYHGIGNEVRVIVGDTLVDDRHYFIRRDSTLAVGTVGPFVHTFYLRYDTSGTVVTIRDLAADTLQLPHSFLSDQADFLMHFDLQAAFGDTLLTTLPEAFMYTTGSYDAVVEVGFEQVPVAAEKCFFTAGTQFPTGGACFAADLGVLWSGNIGASLLGYARINGQEYGERRYSSPTNTEIYQPTDLATLAVYPNPVHDTGTLAYTLPTPQHVWIELHNILGQAVHTENRGLQPSGLHRYALPISGLAAGIYVVRLRTEAGLVATKTIVIQP